MTIEEAIKVIKSIIDVEQEYGGKDNIDALNMAISALERIEGFEGAMKQFMWERDIAIGQLKELGYSFGQKIEPCDEKRDCSTCKYEHNDGHTQPCRDCGTLLESYTNWEQKER